MKQVIKKLQSDALYRRLELSAGIDFSSNDYLGLAKSPYLKNKLIEFIDQGGYLWRCSSRLVSGTTFLHLETENKIANFLDRPESLLFQSGYCANIGVISTIGKDSIIFSDEKNHASIIDGIKLSKSQVCIYKHNDINDLHKKIELHKADTRKKVIITESIFSMSGNIIDIMQMSDLARHYDTILIIDEAHATGVFGTHGQGLTEGIKSYEKLITVHTGGKALGASGAFVGCSSTFKKYLVNKAKSFIYTTGVSPISTYMLKESIQFVSESSYLRDKLQSNINHFNSKLNIKGNRSPIYALKVLGNRNVLNASKSFIDHGIHIKAMRYPTVQKGEECLRVSLHADHSQQDLIKLTHVYNHLNYNEGLVCSSTL